MSPWHCEFFCEISISYIFLFKNKSPIFIPSIIKTDFYIKIAKKKVLSFFNPANKFCNWILLYRCVNHFAIHEFSLNNLSLSFLPPRLVDVYLEPMETSTTGFFYSIKQNLLLQCGLCIDFFVCVDCRFLCKNYMGRSR